MEYYKDFIENVNFRLSLLKTKQEDIDLVLSSKFSVFDYIYFGENNISDIIRDLLDINGKHGQKNLFFKLFLEMLFDGDSKNMSFINSLSSILPNVQREVRTIKSDNNRRRIDLVINWNNEFALGIENKPFDKDQVDQLKDYSTYLEREYKNSVLIYLAEREPGNQSISNDSKAYLIESERLVLIKYVEHINNWLDRCILYCKSQKVNFFLEDFRSKLNNHFMKIEVENSNAIVDFALKDLKNIETTFEIYHSYNNLLSQVANSFTKKISERFNSEKYEILSETNNSKIKFYVRLKSWDSSIWCGILDDGNDIYISVEKEKEDLFNIIKSKFHGSSVNDHRWWAYPDNHYRNWQNDPKKIHKMNGNESIDYYYDYLQNLIKLVNDFYNDQLEKN